MSAKLVIDCQENNFGQMMTSIQVLEDNPSMREKKAVIGLGRMVHLCMAQMAKPTIHSSPSQQEILRKAFLEAGIDV